MSAAVATPAPSPVPVAAEALLFDTHMELNGTGGGQRRASQIARLIERAGFTAVPLRLDFSPEFRRHALAGVRDAWRAGARPWRGARGAVVAAAAYRSALTRHPGPKVLVRERTCGYGRLAPELARSFGFRTVVLPQNLESLVAGQLDPLVRFRSRAAALADEIDRLAREDKVFCISREEQWLLTAHGIPADHLPYFPTPEWEADLLRVRAARRPATPRRFLVIGSVSNPPVRAGVVEILRRAAPLVAKVGGAIHVAGNSTELLAREAAAVGAILHGRLPDHELDALLATATAALVYQPWGCGALTKIPELLLAGVPVLANGIAARSAYHYPGVYPFETDAELAELIRADLPTPPPPPRPTQAESRFVDTLRDPAAER